MKPLNEYGIDHVGFIVPDLEEAVRQAQEYLREDPVRGYGLFCFCQGLALGLRRSEACRRD